MSSPRALLLRIGDKCSEYGGSPDYREHIDTCFSVISREIEHDGDEILELILQGAEQLPYKAPFYGVLVGLINLENEGFAKIVVDTSQSSLQDALYSGNCDKIRLMMRFLTVLLCSKVLSPISIIELFETLLSSAATIIDEEYGNPSWQSCADFYVTCILSCLPWGGAELSEQVPVEFEQVISGIQSYLSIRRHRYDIGLSVFECNADNVSDEKDFLEDLWQRIQILSDSGWIADSVPCPHLSYEALLVGGKCHDLSSTICPAQPASPSSLTTVGNGMEKHEADLKYPQRLRRLNIFPSSKAEMDMKPIDRFIIEEYLLDVLLFFNGCRKECASYMVGLPVPFRYDFLMAETIFSQLLLLPKAPFKPIYYTLVIIDLCKALPGAFPAVVVAAVRALFERIGDMDMECQTRLTLWFSHHLSNFQYVWPWKEWAYVKDLPKWCPQHFFVHEVLEREMRLSYLDKIKQSIDNAPALEELLPPKDGPNFKYSVEVGRDTTEGHTLSAELNSLVKGGKNAREISLWIEENILAVHGLKISLEVTVQTLLDIGSKSFTHLTTVFERYSQVILKLCPDHVNQILLLDVVGSFWENNNQMVAVTIERMMGYRLVSNLSIVSWIFSPCNVDWFHISDRPWEILRNTVSKTCNRTHDLQKEILSLRKSILLAEKGVVKTKQELDSAESKLEIVDGQPVQAEKPGRLKRLRSYVEKAQGELTNLEESLEAKEALLSRAVGETKALFLSLFIKFRGVLAERLPALSADGNLPDLRANIAECTASHPEEAHAMEVDGEKNNVNHSYNIREQEQWCLSTLGHVRAFARQYASEIWPHIETIDKEILIEGVHPLYQRAFNVGLGRWSPVL